MQYKHALIIMGACIHSSTPKPMFCPERIFKAGDTLSIPFRILDRSTGKGYPLSSDTIITSRLNDYYGHPIVDLVPTFYPDQDQDANAGWFLLSPPTGTSTANFPLGKVRFDVRLTTPSFSKTFKEETFEIKGSQTPPYVQGN